MPKFANSSYDCNDGEWFYVPLVLIVDIFLYDISS